MTSGDPEPGARPHFNRQWNGYDRREVDAAIKHLTDQLELLRTDRDAAIETAEDVNRELDAARSELSEYRMLHAGYSKENTVSGAIRYLMHVARQKAEKEEQEARERSEALLRQADQYAERQAVLLDETEQETQRRLAEADRMAREIVGSATAEAQAVLADLVERRKLLDRWCAELDVPLPRDASGPIPTPADDQSATADDDRSAGGRPVGDQPVVAQAVGARAAGGEPVGDQPVDGLPVGSVGDTPVGSTDDRSAGSAGSAGSVGGRSVESVEGEPGDGGSVGSGAAQPAASAASAASGEDEPAGSGDGRLVVSVDGRPAAPVDGQLVVSVDGGSAAPVLLEDGAPARPAAERS
ncbi:cell division septum initiation protein DivIVA [Saccharothrix tamanrassetensis]|uniref:Cell division septum initiation protein DivIVA n=1 Tax=Saccharothrix tamanrassetensis TaxID=1051531 RepID=A0A841CPP6_9PSEU|nr:hypothetical protein [Saccharothrix tamanrassetensis]MBB5959269.1 cell division septum initiation protein DivIVA [Saccharothrix tamanrassetensis]